MINFITSDKQADVKILKLRGTVMTVTTIFLVSYLVLVTGLGGWRWLWTSKQKKSSEEIEGLKVKISQLAEKENLYRQVAGRVEAAANYLANRDLAAAATEAVIKEDFVIEGWDFLSAGPYIVRVNTDSPDEVQRYIDLLTPGFRRVQPININYSPTTGWKGEIQLSGRI